jgi:hypothetical protein
MVSFDLEGGVLSPLTFNVNIERYGVIPAIYLFLLFKDLSVCNQFYAILWVLVCSSLDV